jgi:putative (di)nucleoside polyphosphate hydrolase
MSKIPQTHNHPDLTELLADPIVQMVMKADRVTERQLMESLGAVISRLGTGAKAEPADSPVGPRAARDYRPSVGIMLLNKKNDLFVGRRCNTKGEAWQMPQGGIEDGEDPRAAAFHELKEETGTDKVEILAESKSWLFYDLPAAMISKARHRGWRGQRQKWFAMRFKGSDTDINIKTAEPEFSDWKWAPIEELPALVIPFKKLVYLSVLEEFHDAVHNIVDRS